MKSYLPDFSLLRRNRPFALLYSGQWVSFMGSQMTMVAVPYQVYHMTHSTIWVGVVGLVQLFSLLICALWGGTLADKHHRRSLLLLTSGLASLGSLALLINAAWFSSLGLILLTAVWMAGIMAVDRPARDSLTQQIVAREDYAALSALNTFKMNFCMIAGPAIGGLLVVHIGLVAVFTLDLVSFLFCMLTIAYLPNHANPNAERKVAFWNSLKEGLQFARSRQTLLGSYFVDFFAMLFGMPMALFPAIALHIFGAASLGWLYTAPAVGGLLFSMVSGPCQRIQRHGLGIAISAALWGVAILLFGLMHTLWSALFFLSLAGAFDAASGLFRQTLWNETVPNHLRGRLASLEMLSYLSGPRLGDFESGLVASIWSIPASIISGGILTVISVVGCCWAWPEFTAYNSTVIQSELELQE